MYFKLIKLVVLFSLLVCCEFAGKVLYSLLFNRVIEGKDPRYIKPKRFFIQQWLSLFTAGQSRSLTRWIKNLHCLYTIYKNRHSKECM